MKPYTVIEGTHPLRVLFDTEAIAETMLEQGVSAAAVMFNEISERNKLRVWEQAVLSNRVRERVQKLREEMQDGIQR